MWCWIPSQTQAQHYWIIEAHWGVPFGGVTQLHRKNSIGHAKKDEKKIEKNIFRHQDASWRTSANQRHFCLSAGQEIPNHFRSKPLALRPRRLGAPFSSCFVPSWEAGPGSWWSSLLYFGRGLQLYLYVYIHNPTCVNLYYQLADGDSLRIWCLISTTLNLECSVSRVQADRDSHHS